jgi:WS/DGAT/MGAT family acyltransferase
MPAADSAWLRMETPENLMTITGVLAFERPLDRAALRRLIADRLVAPYPRFRQRVAAPRWGLGRPRWVEDEGFDLERHLIDTELPAPGGKDELQNLVSELMSTPLDPELPLWRFHYVPNFRYGSAVVARVHHAIGDGMSLVQVLLGLAEERTEEPSPRPAPASGRGGNGGAPTGVGEGTPAADRSTSRSKGSPLPGRWERDRVRVPRMVSSLVRLLFRRADPDSALRGPLYRAKRCAWSSPLPLDEIKDLARGLGVTINDLLIAAVAGALRAHLERHHQDVDGLALRAVVPVNLRRRDLKTLGNRFGLVFLPIPVGEPDPARRLAIVKRGMDAAKRSPEALVTYALLRVVGLTTARVVGWAIAFFGRKATAVMTNVPGPRAPLWLCGERLDGMMFWVPQSGRLGLGVSILSYDGGVRVGVAADAGLIDDPREIVAGYGAALAELRSVYSQET